MQYILSQEEYSALTSGTSDSILRETNAKLKASNDELQAKLDAFQSAPSSVEPTVKVVESRFDSPFIVTGSKLCLRSYTDFIILYNGLAQSSFTDSDKEIYEYLTTMAEMFNYKPQFESQKDLKAYRVSLQKKDLYNPIVKDGRRYLEFTDAKF